MIKQRVSAFAGFVFLAAATLCLPLGANAEMYVEGYIGGAATASDSVKANISRPEEAVPGGISQLNFKFPGTFDNPTVIGGVKVGTWFVKEGFLGMNYPDWMKYFGFYTDFSYQRLNFRGQNGSVAASGPGFATNIPATLTGEGTAATWAFMFAARYGFFPDSEVPFGRLQPYVAVGPAILFSSQEPKLGVPLNPVIAGTYGAAANDAGSTDIALAVDAGVRWMCLKNVSIDISFKYRWAEPSYSFSFNDPYTGVSHSYKMSPSLNMFSGQVGAAYHF